MEDKLDILYKAVSPKYDIGSPEDFRKKMSYPDKRKAFYDGIGKEYSLGSFDEFDTKIRPEVVPQGKAKAYNIDLDKGVTDVDTGEQVPVSEQGHPSRQQQVNKVIHDAIASNYDTFAPTNDNQSKNIDVFFNTLKEKHGYNDAELDQAKRANKAEFDKFRIPLKTSDDKTREKYNTLVAPKANVVNAFTSTIGDLLGKSIGALSIIGEKGADVTGLSKLVPNNPKGEDFLYKTGKWLQEQSKSIAPETEGTKIQFLPKQLAEPLGVDPEVDLDKVSESAATMIYYTAASALGPEAAAKELGESFTSYALKSGAKHAAEQIPLATSAFTGGYEKASQRVNDAKILSDEEYVNKYNQGDNANKLIEEKKNLETKDAKDVGFKAGLGDAMASGIAFGLPVAQAMEKINTVTGGALANIVDKGFKGSLTGMTQMSLQQFLENKSAKEHYDTTRELWDNVVQAGTSGAIANGILAGLGTALGGKSGNVTSIEDKAHLKAANAFIEDKQSDLSDVNPITPHKESAFSQGLHENIANRDKLSDTIDSGDLSGAALEAATRKKELLDLEIKSRTSQENKNSADRFADEFLLDGYNDHEDILSDVVSSAPDKTTQDAIVDEQRDINNRRSQVIKTKIDRGDIDTEVNNLIDKRVVFNGEAGDLFLDGKSIIFDNNKGREFEVGNVDELGSKKIGELGLQPENLNVIGDSQGNIYVNGKRFRATVPGEASPVSTDVSGNATAVTLIGDKGKPVVFRGQMAQDIAYELTQNKLHQRNIAEGKLPAVERVAQQQKQTQEAIDGFEKERQDAIAGGAPKDENITPQEINNEVSVENQPTTTQDNPVEQPVVATLPTGQELKRRVSEAGDSLKRLLSAKSLPEGTQKMGLGVGEIIDGGVKIIHDAIDAGVEVSEAIKKGLDHIKGSEWYRSLSDVDKKDTDLLLEDHLPDLTTKTEPTEAELAYSPPSTLTNIEMARNLDFEAYKLKKNGDADVMEAVKLVQGLPEEFKSKEVNERIYKYAEGDNVDLTPKELELYDKYVKPLQEEYANIYGQVRGNYPNLDNLGIPRVVRYKGDIFTRAAEGAKNIVRGGVLSKSAGTLKKRSFMSLADAEGNRILVHRGKNGFEKVKDGRYTKITNKEPVTNEQLMAKELAPIDRQSKKLSDELELLTSSKKRADVSSIKVANIRTKLANLAETRNQIEAKYEGKDLSQEFYKDKQGNLYSLKDAFTSEIEANTRYRYHKYPVANLLISNIQLGRVKRAMDFLDTFKTSDEFKKFAIDEMAEGAVVKVDEEGYRRVSSDLPQFRGYYFEPRTAAVLDNMAKTFKDNPLALFGKLNNFFRNTIVMFPFIHIPNELVNWTVARGAYRFASPKSYVNLAKSGTRAAIAVWTKNQDYMDMMRSGASLMSYDNNSAQNIIMDTAIRELRDKKDISTILSNTLGYANPIQMLDRVSKMSHAIAMGSHDIMAMQSIYEKMAEGKNRDEAISATDKYLPNYRLPSSLFNPRYGGEAASKFVSNPNVAVFSAYHYGMYKELGNILQGVVGKDSDVKTRLENADKALAFILITTALYPAMDEMLKGVTGNKNAKARRAGVASITEHARKLYEGKESVGQYLSSVVTPAVGTETAVELAANYDFYTGKKIYHKGDVTDDPLTFVKDVTTFMANKTPEYQMYKSVSDGKKGWGDIFLEQMSVQTPSSSEAKRALNNFMYNDLKDEQKRVKAALKRGDKEKAKQIAKDIHDRYVELREEAKASQ